MKVMVMSFTENGCCLSQRIAEALSPEEETKQIYLHIFTKCKTCQERYVEQSIGEWTKEQMEQKNALLFIGACGIAVRAIAPNLSDKLHDSPVLVADEAGKYVIPLLSGHMGGANELAYLIAEKIGAQPVITTATDINQKFAADMFAKKNDLSIMNREGIAKVSAKVLAGHKVTMAIETGHYREVNHLPKEVRIVEYPPKQPVDVVVSSEPKTFQTALLLRPKEYIIGMGVRRGKKTEEFSDFIARSLQELGIAMEQVAAIASIDLKSEEECFLKWSRRERIPFLTYTAEELQCVKGCFHSSDFVKSTVGIDNVCERAALKAAGPNGRLVYDKHIGNGMTIAIAGKEWSVDFE